MNNTKIHFIKEYKVIEFERTNIYIIENILDKSLCKLIIDVIDNNSVLQKLNIGKNQNVECYKVLDFFTKELNNILIAKIKTICDIINIINNRIHITGFSNYELRKVYGETQLHSDGIFGNIDEKKDIRSITIVVGLNDDYDGGVYSFPYQNIDFNLKAGSALFFPPYWTHPHKVSPIKENQYRYIFSTWALEL